MEINQKYILELKQIIASLELEMSKSEISSDPKKMKDCLAQYSTQKQTTLSDISPPKGL